MFPTLFNLFQEVLALNNQILDTIADLGTKLGGNYVFDQQYIRSTCALVADKVYRIINNLNAMTGNRYMVLYEPFQRINHELAEELEGRPVIAQTDYTMPYEAISTDLVDVVGAKNATLAEVENLLGLTGPEGFAITARAFQSFLEHKGLAKKIAFVTSQWQKGDLASRQAEEKIRALIMAAEVPVPLQKALRRAIEALCDKAPGNEEMLAFRSSALDEDGEHSFAGQYVTLLNEAAEKVLDCYKSVLAGTYSASAMEYRRQKGFLESEVAMAVGCQRMVAAKVSGTLYTLDPRSPEDEVMVITAAWGLGAPLVGGTAKADLYAATREPSHEIVRLDIVRKAERLMPRQGGGVEFLPVPQDLQSVGCLLSDQIRRLAEAGLLVERHFKKPQDIEWALDEHDRLFILQTRPLNIRAKVAQMVCDISSVLRNYTVLFEGRGSIAQEGIGSGKVFIARTDEDLDAFPEGAVLVTRYASPRVGRVIKKANAILTDVGSPTGHMATIAREFRVPAVVNTEVATELLQPGQVVTVDARQNVVYSGTVKELCYYEFTEEAFEEMWEYRLLRRVLKRIAPLNLIDPSDKGFLPSGCKTFHDITRFVHEKAVEELIDLRYSGASEEGMAGRKKLKFDVPLSLVLIDIGEGLTPASETLTVEPKDVASVPMQAFLRGLSEPGVWSTRPLSVDFTSFMSSLTRTLSLAGADPKYVGQNLAIISKEYANVTLRLGYHFNMIDAYISDQSNSNYAYFRFLGGVTEMTRRSRRVRLLADILLQNDFRVDVRGDLVVARIKKLPREGMEEKMRLLGSLVAFTRQLDVRMISDEEIVRIRQEFNGLKETEGEHQNLRT
jgi:pyruvate,water dikinase